MLQRINDLSGFEAMTVGGQSAGRVDSFLFDGGVFGVQYVVLDTGDWLPGRLILISPAALGVPDFKERRIPVLLSKQVIGNSPGIESHMPVSMQHRKALAGHYGWPLYWGGQVPGVMSPPRLTEESIDDAFTGSDADPKNENPLDYPLWRTSELTGFRILAKDGAAGHMDQFIADVPSWMIRYLVLKLGGVLGERVVVSPRLVEKISWDESAFYINLNKRRLENAPAYHPEEIIGRKDIIQV